MATKNLADELGALAQNYANEVMELFRNHAIALIGGDGKGRAVKAPKMGRVERQRKQVMCPVPGCTKPGRGPKFNWACEDHKDTPKKQLMKYRREAKSAATR